MLMPGRRSTDHGVAPHGGAKKTYWGGGAENGSSPPGAAALRGGSERGRARGWALRLACVGAALLGASGGLTACNGFLGASNESGSEDALQVDRPASASRFRRLTHEEWRNTVQDLLGIDPSELSAAFRDDPRAAGFLFDNNAATLEVDQALAAAYQRVAAQIAAELTGDSASLKALVPEVGDDDEARIRSFIEQFGKRVHRRPLTEDQIEAYVALYDVGRSSFDDAPGFAGGVRLLLEGFLQSPYFLYRIESSEEERDGVIPLDGWERAQRLSYFFWATMPDDELFAAAEAGALSSKEEVEAQARRLVADERAASVVERFYTQLFEVDRYTRIQPSSSVFPDVSARLASAAAEETRRFVRYVMYEEQGGIADLLTSNVTFVNADLAPIYGLTGTFDTDFSRVELDPGERSGVLTQIGFLASNATSVNPDPIHRGVFVAKRINCLNIAAPPDAVPPLPQAGDKTNREMVEEHTEVDGTSCKSCHASVINPFGFPFESYDAIGAYRTEDNGKPVDTSASPPIGGVRVDVTDATELAHTMASAAAVHECFAKHLVEFAQGRTSVSADEGIVSKLGTESLTGVDFKEMMVRLAVADSFLNRATEELP